MAAVFKSKAMKTKLQEEAAAAYDILDYLRLQQKEYGKFCKCIVSHEANNNADDPTLCNDYEAYNDAAAAACTNSFHTAFTTPYINYNHIEEQLLSKMSNNPYSTVNNQGIKEIHFVLDLLYVFALLYMLWHIIMHYRWR